MILVNIAIAFNKYYSTVIGQQILDYLLFTKYPMPQRFIPPCFNM